MNALDRIIPILGWIPSYQTLLFALAMLALMLGLEHVAPKVPAPLVTVALGIAVSAFVGLDKMGIALVGTVQAGLPSFALPDLSPALQLWPAALGIALMSFVETEAAGRAFIRKSDPLPRISLAEFRAILQIRSMEFRWALIARCSGSSSTRPCGSGWAGNGRS